MIDPFLSLAFSVFSSKGVYALLLGSGVSRSSGVPTGWEILEDLMRKLAHLEKQEPVELHSWYRDRYGATPNYSEILAQLAPQPPERLKLLQGYFEPTEEECREGRKTIAMTIDTGVPLDSTDSVRRFWKSVGDFLS